LSDQAPKPWVVTYMTRRFVRKVLNKLDMLVCEPACGVAGDGDHAYQLILEDDRDAEQRRNPTICCPS